MFLLYVVKFLLMKNLQDLNNKIKRNKQSNNILVQNNAVKSLISCYDKIIPVFSYHDNKFDAGFIMSGNKTKSYSPIIHEP